MLELRDDLPDDGEGIEALLLDLGHDLLAELDPALALVRSHEFVNHFLLLLPLPVPREGLVGL